MKLFTGLFAAVQAPTSIPQVKIDNTLVSNIFSLVLALAGAVAVAFIVWGGIQYVISQGESSKITQAKNTLLYSIVGLVIVMFSFAILNFVLGKF
jgi:hypothetical protein